MHCRSELAAFPWGQLEGNYVFLLQLSVKVFKTIALTIFKKKKRMVLRVQLYMGLKSLKVGALCFSKAASPTTRSRQVGFVVTSEYLHFLASYYSDINWGESVPLICAYFLKWKGHLLKKERVKETGQLFKICNGVAYLF